MIEPECVGKKFGRLTLLSISEPGERSRRFCECVCDCGAKSIVRIDHLLSKRISSCGCLLRETGRINGLKRRTHGMSETKLFRVWAAMKRRCLNSHAIDYYRYGGRGIMVCQRWMKFENFFEDMGDCPPGMSLERIDNSSGYGPNNCRWATAEEQQNNRRSNHFLTVNGETLTIAQWSRRTSIKASTILWRIKANYSEERLFETAGS